MAANWLFPNRLGNGVALQLFLFLGHNKSGMCAISSSAALCRTLLLCQEEILCQ